MSLEELPNEMLIEIFDRLDYSDKLNYNSISKRFNELQLKFNNCYLLVMSGWSYVVTLNKLESMINKLKPSIVNNSSELVFEVTIIIPNKRFFRKDLGFYFTNKGMYLSTSYKSEIKTDINQVVNRCHEIYKEKLIPRNKDLDEV